MKVKCIQNDGYKHLIEVGKEYDLVSVELGVFPGDYYVIITNHEGHRVASHYWRYDMTKEQAKALAEVEE